LDKRTVSRLKKAVGALLVSPEATRNERVVSLAARLHVDPERLVAMNGTRKVFEGKELRKSSRLLEKTVLEYLCEYKTQGGQRMDQVAGVFAIDVDILVKLNQTFAPPDLTLAHDTLLADGTVLFIPPFPGKVARKLSDLQDSQGGLLMRKCIICNKSAKDTPVQNIINCASCAARWAHRTCHREDILRCNECNGSDKGQHPPKEKIGDSAVELLRFLKKDATISKLNDSKKMMENLCKWVEENGITLADLKKQAALGRLLSFIPPSANLQDEFKMQLYMRLQADSDASGSAEPKRAEQSEGGVQPKQSPIPTGKIPRKNQMARQPEHRERAELTGTGASRHKEDTSQRMARRPPPLTGVSSRLPAPLGS